MFRNFIRVSTMHLILHVNTVVVPCSATFREGGKREKGSLPLAFQ